MLVVRVSTVARAGNFVFFPSKSSKAFIATQITSLGIRRRRKKKVKAVCGSYSTAALRHIVLLPELVPSFISRGAGHTKQLERPLLAKEGTIPGI